MITTANPGPSFLAQNFRSFGMDARPFKVTAANAGDRTQATELALCDGYYFDGGLPRLLSEAFLLQGRDSLALATIRKRFEAGATIAGSSAGAMILGTQTLCTCSGETSFRVLHGAPPEIAKGFGFVNLPIDAHAFVRNLYGRELTVMEKNRWPVMLAIDESGAVEAPGDGSPWRVLGEGAVAIIKRPAVPSKPLMDYDISFLHRGDLIDPKSLEAVTDGRTAVVADHEGLNELLQAPVQALPLLAGNLAAGGAETYAWDWFWDPSAPVRLRLAVNERTAFYENGATNAKSAYLITHLSFSAQVLDHTQLQLAVTGSSARLAGDWGVPAPDGPRKSCTVVSATPIAGPGTTTANFDVIRRQSQTAEALLINTLSAQPNGRVPAIPNSLWLSGAGGCETADGGVKARLADRLHQITNGDFNRPLVFYCANELCWPAYNAAQRARLLGYKQVYWYRGGLRDWMEHGGATVPATDSW